jgi:ADP-ribosyl-[dinitrogen reductase] hydrolase
MELDKIYGCILGAAIGDALGSPFEFMDRGPLNLNFPGGPIQYEDGQPGSLMKHHKAGDVSDDTYMSEGVINGLYQTSNLTSHKALGTVRKEFLKWMEGPNFVKSAPGIATTRALSAGRPVPSEGNGTCMKAHVSASLIDDVRTAAQHAALVAQITHISQTEDHNEAGARLTVYACRYAMETNDPNLLRLIEYVRRFEKIEDEVMEDYLNRVGSIIKTKGLETVDEVSGWVFDTVTYSVAAWLSYPKDYLAAVRYIISAGGDTDSTADVTGAMVGAHVGLSNIPSYLVEGLLERSVLEQAISSCLERKSRWENN